MKHVTSTEWIGMFVTAAALATPVGAGPSSQPSEPFVRTSRTSPATASRSSIRSPVIGFPRVLTVTSDGTTAYQTMRWINGVLVLDLQRHEVVDRIAFEEPVYAPEGKDAHGPALTPDGGELWLTTQTSSDVAVIRTRDRELLAHIPVGRDPNRVDFTRDGQLALISNTGSNDVSVIDVSRRKVVATIPVGASPKRLAVGVVVASTEPWNRREDRRMREGSRDFLKGGSHE